MNAMAALSNLVCLGLIGLLRTLRQPFVCANLRVLGLARNAIGNRGAMALAEHLGSSATPHLEQLELRDNDIGDDGAVALGRALLHTSALRQLGLFHNAIGRHGAGVLATTLAHNHSIEAVDLRMNLIEEGELRTLLEASFIAAPPPPPAGEEDRSRREDAPPPPHQLPADDPYQHSNAPPLEDAADKAMRTLERARAVLTRAPPAAEPEPLPLQSAPSRSDALPPPRSKAARLSSSGAGASVTASASASESASSCAMAASSAAASGAPSAMSSLRDRLSACDCYRLPESDPPETAPIAAADDHSPMAADEAVLFNAIYTVARAAELAVASVDAELGVPPANGADEDESHAAMRAPPPNLSRPSSPPPSPPAGGSAPARPPSLTQQPPPPAPSAHPQPPQQPPPLHEPPLAPPRLRVPSPGYAGPAHGDRSGPTGHAPLHPPAFGGPFHARSPHAGGPGIVPAVGAARAGEVGRGASSMVPPAAAGGSGGSGGAVGGGCAAIGGGGAVEVDWERPQAIGACAPHTKPSRPQRPSGPRANAPSAEAPSERHQTCGARLPPPDGTSRSPPGVYRRCVAQHASQQSAQQSAYPYFTAAPVEAPPPPPKEGGGGDDGATRAASRPATRMCEPGLSRQPLISAGEASGGGMGGGVLSRQYQFPTGCGRAGDDQGFSGGGGGGGGGDEYLNDHGDGYGDGDGYEVYDSYAQIHAAQPAAARVDSRVEADFAALQAEAEALVAAMGLENSAVHGLNRRHTYDAPSASSPPMGLQNPAAIEANRRHTYDAQYAPPAPLPVPSSSWASDEADSNGHLRARAPPSSRTLDSVAGGYSPARASAKAAAVAALKAEAELTEARAEVRAEGRAQRQMPPRPIPSVQPVPWRTDVPAEQLPPPSGPPARPVRPRAPPTAPPPSRSAGGRSGVLTPCGGFGAAALGIGGGGRATPGTRPIERGVRWGGVVGAGGVLEEDEEEMAIVSAEEERQLREEHAAEVAAAAAVDAVAIEMEEMDRDRREMEERMAQSAVEMEEAAREAAREAVRVAAKRESAAAERAQHESEQVAAVAIVAQVQAQAAQHEAAAAAEVAVSARQESSFQQALHDLEAEMTQIQLHEVAELLAQTHAEVDTALPRGSVDPAPALPDLLTPWLSDVTNLLVEVERSATDDAEHLASMHAQLTRASVAHAAVETSLQEEVGVRERLETDAADVAESLLEADRTIDTLSAEIDTARARTVELEDDVATAKAAATEQAAAVTAHAAALSDLDAARRAEGVSAQATLRDLADGLVALGDHLLVPPSRHSSSSALLLAGGGFSAAASTATALATSQRAASSSSAAHSWVAGARRAWSALERLEGGQLMSVSTRHDATILSLELRAAEGCADEWRASYGRAAEAMDGLMEELRVQRASHELTSAQTAQHLALTAAQSRAEEKALVTALAETDAEAAAAAASVRALQKELRAQLEQSMGLVGAQHAQLEAYAPHP